MTGKLEPRDFDRPLDVRLERVDVCPTCGGPRQELPLPDVFYCERCEVGTIGPNTVAPAPAPAEPEALFDVGALVQDEAVDRPPIDETQQWAFDDD